MFELGQPVVVQNGDGQKIGEVIGEWGSADSPFYDVSLLQTVEKAVPQRELRLATVQEVSGLLSSMMTSPVGALTERDALLQRQYALFLARALAGLENSAPEEGATPAARFSSGDQVALHEDGAIVLGVVKGRATRNTQVHYVVEALGEERMVPEADVEELAASGNQPGIGLGARVRFVAQGHEDDDDFLGVVCSLSQTPEGDVYAILFDDGDVLEDLTTADLQLV